MSKELEKVKENIENIKQKNRELIVHLFVDQGFYDNLLSKSDEQLDRIELQKKKEEIDNFTKTNEVQEKTDFNKDDDEKVIKSKEDFIKGLTKLKEEKSKIEARVNKSRDLKVQKENGLETIKNIQIMLGVIDKFTDVDYGNMIGLFNGKDSINVIE